VVALRHRRLRRLPQGRAGQSAVRAPPPELQWQGWAETLGHDFTIPLCGWHHVGRPPEGHDSKWAETNLGPSLAKQSKKFREKYGSDQHLLDYTNGLITESYSF
jgi:hypothetical protein